MRLISIFILYFLDVNNLTCKSQCSKNYGIYFGSSFESQGGICSKNCTTCTENAQPNFNNTYISLDLTEVVTDDILELRSNILLEKAKPGIVSIVRTKVQTVLANDSSQIATLDPVCTDEFCNYHGDCMLILKYLSCDCSTGYAGSNCHLVYNDYEFLKSEISKHIAILLNNH